MINFLMEKNVANRGGTFMFFCVLNREGGIPFGSSRKDLTNCIPHKNKTIYLCISKCLTFYGMHHGKDNA